MKKFIVVLTVIGGLMVSAILAVFVGAILLNEDEVFY